MVRIVFAHQMEQRGLVEGVLPVCFDYDGVQPDLEGLVHLEHLQDVVELVAEAVGVYALLVLEAILLLDFGEFCREVHW